MSIALMSATGAVDVNEEEISHPDPPWDETLFTIEVLCGLMTIFGLNFGGLASNFAPYAVCSSHVSSAQTRWSLTPIFSNEGFEIAPFRIVCQRS